MNSGELSATRHPSLRAIMNFIAAVGLAAALFLTSNDLSRVWNPGEWGSFGLTFGAEHGWQGAVAAVAPGSAAERAGIEPGDSLDFVTAHDRAVLFVSLNTTVLPAGERLDPVLTRQGVSRTVTLTARPSPRLSVYDDIALVLLNALVVAGISVAVLLVLLRPSRLTWGFYFVVLVSIFAYCLDQSLLVTYLVTHFGLWVEGAQNLTYVAAAVGFLIFCARFPTDAPRDEWAKKADSAAPYIFATIAALRIWHDAVNFRTGASTLAEVLDNTTEALNGLVYAAGLIVLLRGYFDASDADRQRIKWVVVGLVSSFTAIALWSTSFFVQWVPIPDSWAFWWITMIAALALVLPLTVTYSIVRHRVIDVRFVLDRSLVLGIIAATAALVVLALDWLFSARLPSTPAVMAAYGLIAVVVGLSLGAARDRLREGIDFLLFRRWYDAQAQADVVGVAISRATDKAEIYEPLTVGITRAFLLASAAIFERMEDGGYMRVAAVGWPKGTFWHLFARRSS